MTKEYKCPVCGTPLEITRRVKRRKGMVFYKVICPKCNHSLDCSAFSESDAAFAFYDCCEDERMKRQRHD